jgi:hypothetical protein
VQRELFAFDGGAQLPLDVQPFDDPAAKRLVEDLCARPPALFRPVHRRVGVSEENLRVVFAHHRDADACGDDDLFAADRERLLHELEHAAGERVRVDLAADALAHHHELVATEAGYQVAGTQRVTQARREIDEQLVAGRVPHAVVEDLEPVDVQEEHRGLRVTVTGRLGDPAEAVDDALAVRKTSQLVMARLVRELRLRPVAFDREGGQVRCQHKATTIRVVGLGVIAAQQHHRPGGRPSSTDIP